MDIGEAQKQRLMELNALYETRQDTFQRTMLVQDQRTKWHDKLKKFFQPGDWVLLYDSRFKNFKGKLSTR